MSKQTTLLLVGRRGSGKSSVGNSILGRLSFKPCVMRQERMLSNDIDSNDVFCVVDCSGVGDTGSEMAGDVKDIICNARNAVNKIKGLTNSEFNTFELIDEPAITELPNIANVPEFFEVIPFPINSPGIGNSFTNENQQKDSQKTESESIYDDIRGFDALIFVLKYGVQFTKQEKDAVEMVKSIFGENVFRDWGILVFSYGDNFYLDTEDDEITFEEWCWEQTGDIKLLFEEVQYRCVIFDNKSTNKYKELENLKGNIERVTKGGRPYTLAGFDNARSGRVKLQLNYHNGGLQAETHSLLTKAIHLMDQPLPNHEHFQKVLDELLHHVHKLIHLDEGTGVLKPLLEHVNEKIATLEAKMKQNKSSVDKSRSVFKVAWKYFAKLKYEWKNPNTEIEEPSNFKDNKRKQQRDRGESEPEPVNRRACEPEPVNRKACEPEPFNRGACEPEPVNRRACEPEPFNRGACEPEPFNRGACEPEPVNRGACEPEPVNRRACEPEPVNRRACEPEPFNRKACEPEPVNRRACEPEPVNRRACEPEPFNRGAYEPEPVNREICEPEPVNREICEPEPVNYKACEPEPVYHKESEPEPVYHKESEPEQVDPEDCKSTEDDSYEADTEVDSGYLHSSTNSASAHRPRPRLDEVFDISQTLESDDDTLNVKSINQQNYAFLLVGRSGNGKSSTGNSIFGKNVFITRKPQDSFGGDVICYHSALVDGRTVFVVDGTGMGDTVEDINGGINELLESVDFTMRNEMSKFNAIVLVHYIHERSQVNMKSSVHVIKSILGPNVFKNWGIIAVTFGDQFDVNSLDENIHSFEEWRQQQTGYFQILLEECNNRCVLFDNITTDKNKQMEQRQKLMSVVDSITYRNYTRKEFDSSTCKLSRQQLLLIEEVNRNFELFDGNL